MNKQGFTWLTLATLILWAGAAYGAQGDVEKINRAIAEQGAKWVAAETPYTNFTPEQKRALLGLLPANPIWQGIVPEFTRQVDEIDEEVDWRNRNGENWVTPVRNQGQCGSCWAFGGVAAMESKILISGNTPGYPLDLSEQFLVSCSQGSCNGWGAAETVSYLQNEGTVDEPCLPYGASDLIPCTDRCSDWIYRNMKLENWGFCTGVAQMKAALNVAPITGCFIVYDDFMSYGGGVYQHVWGDYAGGHMISIVGYSEAQNAWICKNSWGGGWGEDGYFMIRMGYDECGIESGSPYGEPMWVEAAQAEFPNLIVGETLFEESLGDGDGVLNPGETANLFVALQNAPLGATAIGITAQILCDDPRVTILDNAATYPDAAGSSTVSNTGDPFSLAVASGCALGPVELTLYIYANESAPLPYYVEREVSIEVSLFQAGFPLGSSETDASPAICDLDGDGNLDVISADFGGLIMAADGTGNVLPGFPYQTSSIIKGSPAVADLDGDLDLEIVCCDWNGSLFILNNDGSQAVEPIELPIFVSAAPALGDLDGDGDLEIVLGCWDGYLYAFHHEGTLVAGFPFQAQAYQPLQDGALLLDLNMDNLPEILFGCNNHRFYAVDGNGQMLWIADLGSVPSAAASAADLGEGSATIVVPDQGGHIHFLNTSGEEIRTVDLGVSCKSSPSFADLNDDGTLEIALNDQSGGMHALTAFGEELPGFPVQTGSSIWGSTSFSDLNNDGHLELIAANNAGYLHVRRDNGASLPGYPLLLSSGSRSTPSVINLDQDGDLEIVIGTFLGLDAVDYKQTAGQNDCWNTYRGNIRRTGYYGDGFFAVGIPQAADSKLPQEYALLPAHPNPFNPEVQLGFTLPEASSVTMEIYDMLGRKVATLVDGFQAAGRHSLTWSAQSGGSASGVYVVNFSARGNGGNGYNATQKILLLK